MSTSPPIFTSESLVQDCVGRYITTGRGALRLTNLINSKSYAEAWVAVQHWARHHFHLGNSFILSPIGVLNQAPGAPPQFAFFRSFVDKFGLETVNVAHDTDPNTVIKMYTSALAKYAPGLDRERLKLALQHLFQRLGEMVATRAQCLIEFGFATLAAEDRRIAMVLHAQPGQDQAQTDAEDVRKSLDVIQHRQQRARYSYIGAKRREGLSWMMQRLESDVIRGDRAAGGMDGLGHGDLSSRLGRRALSPSNRIAMDGRCPSPPRLRDLPEHERVRPCHWLCTPLIWCRTCTHPFSIHSVEHVRRPSRPGTHPYHSPPKSHRTSPRMWKPPLQGPGANPSLNRTCAQARLWSLKPGSGRLVRSMPESSARESKTTPAFESITVEPESDQEQQLKRYQFYIRQGIDETHIAPIRDEWIQNILRLLNMNLSALHVNDVEALIRDMLSQVESDYKFSVRRAIVDYVLRDRGERVRLKLGSVAESTVADWGSCRSLPSPPIEWRSSIQQAWVYLDTNLHTMNPAAAAVLRAWQRNESLSLIWIPSESQLPMSLQDFESRQKSHLKDQIAHFSNDWIKGVEDIVRGRIDAKDADLFESLATLMTNLLRGVVEQSARHLHQFLTRFRNANDVAFAPDQIASVLNIVQDERPEPGMSPVFAVRLVVQRRKIQLQVLQSEVESTIARIFDAVLCAFDSLPRIETKLCPLLDNPKTLALRVDDDRVTGQHADIVHVFRQSAGSALAVTGLYEEFAYVLDESQRLAEWVSQPRTLSELRERIDTFRTLSSDLTSKTRDWIRCGMMALDSSKVNETLIGKASELSKQILSYVASRNIEHNVVISDEFKVISAMLLKKPTSSKELVDLVRYSNNFKQTTLKRLMNDCANSADELRFLFDCDHLVNDEVFGHAGSAFAWVKKIDAIIVEADTQLMHERRKMEGQFEARKEKFTKLLDSYWAQIADLAEFTDVKREAEFNTIIRNLKENLVAANEDGRRIQEQEELLGLPISEFSLLDQCTMQLAPFDELWTLVQEFRQHHTNWVEGPVFSVDADQVKSRSDSMWRTATKLSKQVTAAAGSVATNIKTALDQFKQQLPLIEILCNPDMRPRHWSAISETVGFDLRPDDHTSLTRFLDMGLGKWIDQLGAISESASNELAIDRSVDAMNKAGDAVGCPAVQEHDLVGLSPEAGAEISVIKKTISDC